MRKALPCIIMAAWISVLAIKAFSLVLQKDLDYLVILPSGWTTEAKQGVKGAPALVNSTFRAVEKASLSEELPIGVYLQLRDKIFGGKVEYMYGRDRPRQAVFVYEKPGGLSVSVRTIEALCNALADELSHGGGGTSALRTCQIVTLGSTPALHLVIDDFEGGQTSVQYVVSKGPRKVLIFAASQASEAQSGIAGTELGEILKTFQLIGDE